MPAALKAAVAGKRVVWLHAVSVGEVLAATRLVAELEAALGEGWVVAVSTTTRTGQALARQRFGEGRVFYMPLDFAFAVRAYLRALKPAGLILMESELWPRLLHECSRRNIPVAVANARVSDRSFRRAMKVRALWKHLVRKPTLWLAQSEEDARRLVAMGALSKVVKLGGNLKYDVRAQVETRVTALISQLLGGNPLVLVAGSTLSGEEGILLNHWAFIRGLAPGAILILAPRHPERFKEVEELVAASDYRVLRASALSANHSSSANLELGSGILLLDTIGDLASIYRLARVAFVGGSLVQRGGHNPLEAAQFGVPVVMGPSYENFRDVVRSMLAANAIWIGEKAEDVVGGIVRMLLDDESASACGRSAHQVFIDKSGATKRSVDAIVSMVSQ